MATVDSAVAKHGGVYGAQNLYEASGYPERVSVNDFSSSDCHRACRRRELTVSINGLSEAI